MLTLPYPPRRAWIVALWINLAVAAGIPMTAILAALFGPAGAIAGAAAMAGAAAAGLKLPALAGRVYRVWSRAERAVRRIVREAVTAVCFFTIVTALRWTGRELRLQPHSNGSQWQPRGAVPAVGVDDGWIGTYVKWAWRSGNTWAVFLLPFLILMNACRLEGEQGFASNIYTLF